MKDSFVSEETSWFALFQKPGWNPARDLRIYLGRNAYSPRPERIGILLYGSLARQEADCFSDLDLMHVENRTRLGQEQIITPHGRIDLTTIAVSEILPRIGRRYSGNNNTFLNALVESVILEDTNNQLRTLKIRAHEIYKAGPGLVSTSSMKQKLQSLRKRWLTLETYAGRAARSDKDKYIFSLHCDQFMKQVTECDFELKNRWGRSVQGTVADLDRLSPPLADLWRAYLNLRSRSPFRIVDLLGIYLTEAIQEAGSSAEFVDRLQ